MNVTTIRKPAPYCPIPFGHPLFSGYVPADQTNIRRTFRRHADYADDYDMNERSSHLDMMMEHPK